jgi:hypothetical protein
MVSRLIRQSPNCGYAEVQIIEHSGSHHKPGDVILMNWEEYEAGRPVRHDMPAGKAILDTLLSKVPVQPPKKPPTRSKSNGNAGKQGKGKSKKAAR